MFSALILCVSYVCSKLEILILEASDCLRDQSDVAYENLAVMSADPSQPCSPASRMSGGDYDGDEAFMMRIPSLVDSFRQEQPTPHPDHLKTRFGSSSMVSVSSILRDAKRIGQTESHAMQAALKTSFVQASRDAAGTGTLNMLWLKNADKRYSISSR